MIALLSKANDRGDGWVEVGTEGVSIVRNATRRKILIEE